MYFREGGRCSHCGRVFTPSQWRKMKFWCSGCARYYCQECLVGKNRCPECGKKATEIVERLFLGGIVGAFMFLISIIGLISIILSDPSSWPNIFVILIIFGPFVLPLFIFLPVLLSRRKSHVKYLEKLPAGEIPPTHRPGWKSEVVGRATNYNHLPDGVGIGLRCYWFDPVMTKDQIIENNRKTSKKIFWVTGGMFFLGFISIASVMIFPLHKMLYLIPVCLFLSSVLIILFSFGISRALKKADRRNSTAYYNKVGFKRTYSSVEKFLEISGIELRKTAVKNSVGSKHTNPVYKYHISDGITIETTYNERRDGTIMGHITINYRYEVCDEARILQNGLDSFFSDLDLLHNRSMNVKTGIL